MQNLALIGMDTQEPHQFQNLLNLQFLTPTKQKHAPIEMYSRIGADFSKPNVSCTWRQEMAIGAPKFQNGQNSISLAVFCPILTEMWNRTRQLRNWMCFYFLPNPSFSSITPPLLSPLKLVHFPLYPILPLILSPLSFLFLFSSTLSSSSRTQEERNRGTGKWDGQQKVAAWWFHLDAVWY